MKTAHKNDSTEMTNFRIKILVFNKKNDRFRVDHDICLSPYFLKKWNPGLEI